MKSLPDKKEDEVTEPVQPNTEENALVVLAAALKATIQARETALGVQQPQSAQPL